MKGGAKHVHGRAKTHLFAFFSHRFRQPMMNHCTNYYEKVYSGAKTFGHCQNAGGRLRLASLHDYSECIDVEECTFSPGRRHSSLSIRSVWILKRVLAVAEFKLDALHFFYCMTALCPFLSKYEKAIHEEYPSLEIVHGTHKPMDKPEFQSMVRELLCPAVSPPRTMIDVIKGTLRKPE